MNRLLAAPLVAVLLCSGCIDWAGAKQAFCEGETCGTGGGDGGDSGNDGGPPDGGDAGAENPAVAFAAFCEQLASDTCDVLFDCHYARQSDHEDCMRLHLANYRCEESTASVRAGFLHFDVDAGARCLAKPKMPSNDCSAGIRECSGYLLPAAELDAGCLASADCRSEDTVCSGEACARKCVAAGDLNQPCLRDALRCHGTLWCDPLSKVCRAPKPVGPACTTPVISANECDPSVAYCSNLGLCAQLPVAGQACHLPEKTCSAGAWCDDGDMCQPVAAVSQPCTNPRQCGPDAFCNIYAASITCEAKLGVGFACFENAQCTSSLVCYQQICYQPLPLDASCVSNAQCTTGRCDAVYRRCRDWQTYLRSGETCTNDTLACDPTLPCEGLVVDLDGGSVGTPGKCAANNLGQACYLHPQCSSRTYCADGGILDGGYCETASGNNPCDTSTRCAIGSYCDKNNRCAIQKSPGAQCLTQEYDSCVFPVTCKEIDGGVGSCVAPGATGSACLSVFDCDGFQSCTAGQCRDAGHLGQSCLRDVFCYRGECNHDAGVCGPPLDAGAPCELGFQCANLMCIDGQCGSCG